MSQASGWWGSQGTPRPASTSGAAGRLTSLTHYAPRDAGDDEDTGPITDNEILGQYVYLLREDGRRIGAIEKHDAGTDSDNSDLITTRWAWSYDSMGRLTQKAYDSPSSGADYVHTYAFDDAGNRESWLKDTDPAFGSTGTGHLTFDVQSFAEEVTVTYDYDANDRLLTETLDAPGAADDRHTVYDWDGGDSTMRLGRTGHEGLDDLHAHWSCSSPFAGEDTTYEARHIFRASALRCSRKHVAGIARLCSWGVDHAVRVRPSHSWCCVV